MSRDDSESRLSQLYSQDIYCQSVSHPDAYFFLLTVLGFVDVIIGVSVSARPRRSEIVLEDTEPVPR